MIFFHLKSFFRSQDIQIFVLTFCSCRKNDLIRKVRLFSKSVTSQPGSQAYCQNISIILKLTYNKSKLYKTLDYWSRDMLNFDFLKKGLEIISVPHFVHGFSNKNISHVIFYWLTKLHCLIAFTSWDIDQYVYCNCLFRRLRRHKF